MLTKNTQQRVESQFRFPLPNLILTIFTMLVFNSGYAQNPTAYIDSYYHGNYINLTQCIPDLHKYGFGDKLSSCQIPSGWKLVFYLDKNYCGQSWTFTESVNYFHSDNYGKLGDNASSVDVYYNGVLQGTSYNCPAKPTPPIREPSDRY